MTAAWWVLCLTSCFLILDILLPYPTLNATKEILLWGLSTLTTLAITLVIIWWLLGDSDPECCGYMSWAVANWATRTPVYHKPTPSAHWNQSKHSANELAVFYIVKVLCFAKGLCSEDGKNLRCWPFGLQPACLTSRSLSFLCFDWARTIIREGKAHCYILTDPRLGLEHSLGFWVGTAAFARPDSLELPPASLLPLPSQLASQATMPSDHVPVPVPVPVQILCPLLHTHPRLVWPHARQPPPPSRPTLLAPDWTQEPTPLCCHFATNSVGVLSGQFRFHSVTKSQWTHQTEL